MTSTVSGSARGSLVAGVLAAFGASACCFGPLALVTLGFGGAWAANLRRLEPLQPLFIGLTLLFLGVTFHRLYIRPRRCAADEACAPPAVLRRQRALFWLVSVAAAAMVAFPFYASLLY
ncbi:MAG TPA: mercuric transporter MerT family protein [Burkholderiaceae bacterium]|nr:mercuric transporter MerT family protein [Burkholderiaceae bacterium]